MWLGTGLWEKPAARAGRGGAGLGVLGWLRWLGKVCDPFNEPI